MDDRYQISQLLEELAFGNIYEAEDTLIQRKVQIFRYFVPASGNEAEWKETFHASSAELGTASHPGLPIIYTHGIDEEGPYSIRQLLDTTILNTRLADSGPLSEYEAWELAQQILEIHAAAKPSGNFHGALDANHIGLITRPSGKKLYSITDYGLAEVSRRIHESTDYVGAPYLISPEQAKGEPASEISQIYAIGQLIFHAFSGGHPWIQTPLEEIIEFQKTQPLELVSAYNDRVPEAMAQWIAKLIALDPRDRFQSYDEAVSHLPEPIQSAPVPVQATSTIYNVPATHTTATQTVSVEGNMGRVSAADAFAAQQKEAQGEKGQILKNPLVLAGIGTIVLITVCIIFFTGGADDDAYESNYVSIKETENTEIATPPRVDALSTGGTENDITKPTESNSVSSKEAENTETANPPRVDALSSGGTENEATESNSVGSKEAENPEIARLPHDKLFAYIDFDDEQLVAKDNARIKLIPLKDKPAFSRSGRSGKGLTLDKTHYFSLPLSGTPMGSSTKDFTISFWLKPHKSSELDLVPVSKQPRPEGATEDRSVKHVLKPEEAVIVGNKWNMITMVCARSTETITIYVDGKKVGASSNAEIKEINKKPFIYIGCDSNKKFQHATPITIDNIAIWERELSEVEIKDLYVN
jgi:serine/threonine protein kinase